MKSVFGVGNASTIDGITQRVFFYFLTQRVLKNDFNLVLARQIAVICSRFPKKSDDICALD